MGEAKRISDRIKSDQDRSEREDRIHKRAQRVEGDLLKARAEIDRLEKEVERLTDELTASCARAEIQQREAERLRRDNGVLHDAIEKIFEEGAKQLARADTAWNDAIEAAKKAVSSLTTPTSEEVMEGHEQAYRAIEALELCKL